MKISKSNILQAKLKTIGSKNALKWFKKTKENTEKILFLSTSYGFKMFKHIGNRRKQQRKENFQKWI